jgi:hypothetical protein
MSRRLLLASLLLGLAASGAGARRAQADCDEKQFWKFLMERARLAKELRQREPAGFSTTPPVFTAADLLHPELAARLAALGPAMVKVSRSGQPYSVNGEPAVAPAWKVAVAVAGDEILTATFWSRPDEPGSVRLDGLSLKDPTREAPPERLRGSQEAKGVSGDAFRHAMRGFAKAARAWGATRILTQGANNYLTTQLYAKLLGAEPSSETGQRLFRMLDEYRKLARGFPQEIRLENPTEFSARLGNNVEPRVRDKHDRVWARYLETGKLPKGMRALKDRAGKVIAVRFSAGEVIFVDHATDPAHPRLLDWYRVVRETDVTLARDVSRVEEPQVALERLREEDARRQEAYLRQDREQVRALASEKFPGNRQLAAKLDELFTGTLPGREKDVARARDAVLKALRDGSAEGALKRKRLEEALRKKVEAVCR